MNGGRKSFLEVNSPSQDLSIILLNFEDFLFIFETIFMYT